MYKVLTAFTGGPPELINSGLYEKYMFWAPVKVEHPYLLRPIHVITDLRDDHDVTDEKWIKEFQLKAPGAKDFALRFVPLAALVNRMLLAVHITFKLQSLEGYQNVQNAGGITES